MSDEFDINNIALISEIIKPIASEIEAFKTSVSDFKEKFNTSLTGSFEKLNDEDEDDIDSSFEDKMLEYLNSNKIFVGDISDGAKFSDNVIKYNAFLTRKKAQEFRLVLNYGPLTQSVAQLIAVYGLENFLFNSVDKIIGLIQEAYNAEFGKEEVIEHSEQMPNDQAVIYDEDSEQPEFGEDFDELPPEAGVDLTGLRPSDPEQVKLERELQEKYDAEKAKELEGKSLGVKTRKRRIAAIQGEPKEFQNYAGPSKKEPLSPAALIAFNLNYENNYYRPKGTYLVDDYKKIIDEVGAANIEYNMLTTKFSSRPVFSGFANLNITIPYNIVEANGVSTIEANTAGNKEFEREFLKRIKNLLKQYDNELNRASYDELNQNILNNIEKFRYGVVNAIDDLVGFLIARDLFTYAKLNDLEAAGVQIASKSDLLNQIIYSKTMANSDIEARKKLDELTKKVIYYKSLSMEAFKVSTSKMGSGFDLKKNEEKLDALFNVYSQFLDKYLIAKINEFFNIEERVNDGFCFYISKSINLETLKTSALNNLSKARTSSWTYIQCPTCNKNIYYSQESELNRYQGRKETYGKDKFSDYNEEIFSLINSDGDMLTTEYLASGGPYKLDGKDYSWTEILKLLKSGNSVDHKLGIQLKKIAMIEAKATRLTKSETPVSWVKTKCPFSNKDYPSELLQALDANRGAKSKGGAPVVSPVDINEFECGMTIDLTQMIKENKIIDPIELNIVPKTKENDPSVILGTLVNAGALTPEEASAYMEEAKLKTAGGWKNSKHVFSCPCKISKTEYVKEGGLKYKYIAMPITGVYKSEFERLNLAHPPTNPDGSLAEVEENTPAYLICGRPVSLSAFERNSSEVGSLYEIMARYAASDEFEKAQELINILMRYGVDMLDILPFIDKFFETLDKTAKLSRRSLITINGMIKAASKKQLNVRIPGTERLTEEILSELKLVCANGHKFFIKDSINFGKRHKGYELKTDEYVKKLSSDSLKLLNNAILADLENPTAMFEKLLAADIINARLSFFEDVTNQPQRLTRLQDISNWNGVPDNLSKCYFVGPNGRKYVFGKSLLSGVLWGLGDRGELIMNDLGTFSTRDSATTRTHIEVSEGVSETIESDARYLTQQALTQHKDSIADEKELDNNRLNPALIEQEYAKVIGSIQTMLLLIKDYSALAVSLDISPNLYNNPIFIGFDPADLIKLKDYSKVILKGVLSYFNKLNAQVSDNFDAILQNAFDIFNAEYISTIEKLDLKSSIALGTENSMFASKRLIAAAIDSIVLALEDAAISTDLITNKLKNKTTNLFYVSQPGQDYMNFLMNEIKSVDSGDSIYISISDAVAAIINLYADIIQKDMKLTGKKAPTKPVSGVLNETELYYLLEGSVITQKTSTFRTGEYLTRLMYMSAALFMADSLSLLYKKYFHKSAGLPTFIFTLGDMSKYVDLSSRDLIIKLNGSEPLFALSQDSINTLSSILSPRKPVMAELQRGLTKLNNLRSAALDIEAEISKMYYATVNEKYMSEAVTMMKAYLANLIKTLPGLSEKSNQKIIIDNKQTRRNIGKRDIANSLIERCLAGSPLIDMDISENSKFVKSIVPAFDQSSESYTIANNRFMLLGTFAAITYPNKNEPSGLPFPIYILKSQDNTFDTFGINISNVILKMEECLILCKENEVVDKSRPVEANIPALIRENGWVLKIAPSKLGQDRVAKKTDGISPILHPLTRGVLSSGKELPITSIEEVVAIRNSYLNIDTTKGYFIGQIAPKVYADAIYPPTTSYFELGEQEAGTPESMNVNNLTSFGVILPILPSEKATGLSGAEKPVIYAKDISAVLQNTETKDLMSINISDFLERHPVALSIDILERIERQNMERKSLLKKTYNDSQKKKINDQYYQYTKALYSTYLNMPLNVLPVNSGTKINQKSISVSNGYYVPLLRYTTINRMLTSDAFFPEMGGHALWAPGNIDQKSMVISSIRSALVKMFNLDNLAEAFNDILSDDIEKIVEGRRVSPGLTGEDLLSPFADAIISDGGFANKIHAAIKASNPANSDKSVLRKILSTSVDYNIDHTYNYFKSTFDANGMSMDDFSGDTSEILSMIHNTASYRQHSRYSLLTRCYNRRIDNKLPLVEKWFFTHGIPTYLAMKPNSGFKANMNLFPSTEGLSEKASKIARIRNLDDNTLPDFKDFETAPYLSMQERSKMLSIRDGEDPQAAALRIYLAGLSAEGYATSIMSWAAELRSQLTELIKSNGRVNVKRLKKTSSKIPYRNLSIRRPLSIIDQPSADIEGPRFELIRSAAAAQSLFFRILHKVNK